MLRRIRSLPDAGAKIDIAMSAMVGDRSKRIARALAAKQRAGASVRFLYSEPLNGIALRRLQDAGIPTRKAMSGDSYLRHKYMTAHYNKSGQDVRTVWTGSEVWTDRALLSDEYVLRLDGAAAHQNFSSNFQLLWDAFDPGA